MIPKGSRDVLSNLRAQGMGDHARFYSVVEDTSTPDSYDTTQQDHYDGQASVHTDRKALRRNERGDEELDADAVVVLPLVTGTVEDKILDSQCEAMFRGQTRTGRAKEVRRRDVTVAVMVDWI